MKIRLRTDGLEWRQIDDEIVVLDAHAGTYLAINGSGALLWPALAADPGASRDELAAKLIAAYGIDEDRARADTAEFVTSLQLRDLLAA